MFLRQLIFLLFFSCSISCGESTPPAILKAEIQELQSVVSTLRDSNQKLEQQNQQLMTEMLHMSQQIRELQSLQSTRQTVAAVAPSAADVADAAASPVTPQAGSNLIRVLYVNPNWHYLLIDAGSKRGVTNGATGTLRRGDEIIGRVVVTDTKENQAVAELDLDSLTERGVYPRKDDEVSFP